MISSNLRIRILCSGATLLGVLSIGNNAFADDGATGLETVVVTGQAESIKKEAPNVLDVQSVEAIRALPDVNAAEALERIPGVSLESDSGEGRFVNIRGMDADLNGTTYDGVRLTASNPSTPQGGGLRCLSGRHPGRSRSRQIPHTRNGRRRSWRCRQYSAAYHADR